MKYSKIKRLEHRKVFLLLSVFSYIVLSFLDRQTPVEGNTQFKLAETLTKLNWECLFIFSKIIKCSLELCLNYFIKWCP